MVQIPERFSLLNRDYEVVKANEHEQQLMDDYEDGPLQGLCDYDDARILLSRKFRKRDSFEHTFFHELSHALLQAIGRSDLSADEDLVDALGGALHHYEKTKAGRLAMKGKKDDEHSGPSHAANQRARSRIRPTSRTHGRRSIGSAIRASQLRRGTPQ